MWISLTDFNKISQYKISQKPICWKPICSSGQMDIMNPTVAICKFANIVNMSKRLYIEASDMRLLQVRTYFILLDCSNN